MSVATILDDVARHGVELRADGDRLRVRPMAKLPHQLANRLRNHKAAIIEFLSVTNITITETPTDAPVAVGFGDGDALAISKTKPERLACNARCKRCGRRIAWGTVVEIQDSAHPAGRKPTTRDRKWIPLDADYMPHGCGRKVRCENKDSIFEEGEE